MRFGVLGPLAVWTSAGTQVTVPGAKVRVLLCVLLVHEGHPVSVDRLVDDLWGARPPGNPVGALQAKVSQLRRALERAEPGGRTLVEHGPAGYRLTLDSAEVDADLMRTLLDRAGHAFEPGPRVELLREALGLWRGPAYADVTDEAFAHPAAERLEELRLTALEDLAHARLDLGEHRLLVGELGDLVERHPLRERMRAAHMTALYRSGRQSEALDSYERLRAHLSEELGLDPGEELTALHRSVLARDPALEAPPEPSPRAPYGCTNLPAPLSEKEDGGLVGRSAQIRRVQQLLETDRLVTLVGPGGVGKTRLAVEAARGLTDRFPDGVWMVDLGDLGPEPGIHMDTDTIAEAVAAALGLQEGPPERMSRECARQGAAERLCTALREQRTLLLLDTCEHLLGPVAALSELLLGASPQVRALATSHEPLGVADERVHPVPPLGLPAGTEDADVSPAVRLFVARAARVSPGFRMQEDDRDAVVAICRRLDGLPLALELAATRVRALGADELARRLDDRFRVLGRGHRTAPRRQQTLRAVLDWSWELLTDDGRAVLRRLSVHRGGCTLDTAEQVCAAGDGVDRADVPALVTHLADRSLVVVEDGAGTRPPRYRLLESVAAYGLERLAEAGEDTTVRHAHADHYAALAEEAEQGLRGHRQREWLLRLDAESANLRSALAWAVEQGEHDLALRPAGATWRYLILRGRIREAHRVLTEALAVEGDRSPARLRVEARLTATGFLLWGEEVSGPPLRELLDAHDDTGTPEDAAEARLLCASAMLGSGDVLVNRELAEEALAGFRRSGNRWGIASALVVRAELAMVSGDLDRSRSDAEEALSLFQQLGDGHGGLSASRFLGTLAEIGGDYDTARRLRTENLRVAEDLGLWMVIAEQTAELGRLALLTGDHETSANLHERALRIARERAYGAGAAFAETGLALADRRCGRLDAAEERMRRLVELNRESGYLPGVTLGMAELGFVAELRGEADTARKLHTEGLTAAHATGDPRAVALACEGLAGAAVLKGDPEQAARLLGFAEAARASVKAPLPTAERGDVDRIGAAARRALGAEGFTAAFEAGARQDVPLL